ncbi:hypothetical protein KCG44_02205 [Pacificimonas sp. WHA3]|uniref:ATP-grasp domain-containing protein n=1 Tax=Pacificimonas pallii TaxID=2827236 RepID=A0ABS6SAZ4_9SPHN|nr:hypothetical protein [Pacificimonas pallii]MBV7255593.1 hypothetical protein [Pacificimonas pallii]
MILLCGNPAEPPMARALDAAERAGADYLLFDQGQAADLELDLRLDAKGDLSGVFRTPDLDVAIEDLTGIYARALDGLEGKAAPLHARLYEMFELAPCRVANRPGAMMTNQSKPYQARLIQQQGLDTPETLITNDPGAVRAFAERCANDGDELIYKSISGVRSIVEVLTPTRMQDLDRLAACPVQFQRRVRGTDVRVHVIGEKLFAARIESEATDYRYARQQVDARAELTPFTLPDDIADRCLAVSRALDLPFTGIDLCVTANDEWFCFEANPSPAYSFFEDETGLPIADALIAWLRRDGALPRCAYTKEPAALPAAATAVPSSGGE